MFSSRASKSNAANGQPPVKPATPSIISKDLRIVGDLASDGEVQVDGGIEGDIRCQVLLIGETANIKGEIVAESVRVHGTVQGQIKAGTVVLAKTARVMGDILHENLSIEQGAFLEGHCRHMEAKKEAPETKLNLVIKEPGAPTPAKAPAEAKEGKEPKEVKKAATG
jgi:cytoskeletal protein CcmA (bactofilin family)